MLLFVFVLKLIEISIFFCFLEKIMYSFFFFPLNISCFKILDEVLIDPDQRQIYDDFGEQYLLLFLVFVNQPKIKFFVFNNENEIENLNLNGNIIRQHDKVMPVFNKEISMRAVKMWRLFIGTILIRLPTRQRK